MDEIRLWSRFSIWRIIHQGFWFLPIFLFFYLFFLSLRQFAWRGWKEISFTKLLIFTSLFLKTVFVGKIGCDQIYVQDGFYWYSFWVFFFLGDMIVNVWEDRFEVMMIRMLKVMWYSYIVVSKSHNPRSFFGLDLHYTGNLNTIHLIICMSIFICAVWLFLDCSNPGVYFFFDPISDSKLLKNPWLGNPSMPTNTTSDAGTL